MKRRVHIYISGIVQGVFFRANLREWAQSRRLGGWVKNLRDGRVEAILEGDEDKIKEVISLCQIGPPGAKVDKVDVKWEEYKGEFKAFEVRY